MPKCQSSPFEEVETLTAGTVRTRGLEPVEYQKATVFAVKSYSELSIYLNCGGKISYNFVCNIIPGPIFPGGAPLCLAVHVPS
jgi:hypothetical protein